MYSPSPARILRNVMRMTKFIEKKSILNPVLSVTILDQIDIIPTSQKVLTVYTLPSISITAKSKALSCHKFKPIDIFPGPGCDDSLIRSEFPPYCPECDETYKREQVLIFREHCEVTHDWLWCDNWFRGDGCEFATTIYEELQEHLDSCDIKPNNLVTIM